MGDEIDLGKLSDREILILVAQTQKQDHARINSHGDRIRRIERIMLLGSGALIAVKAGFEWFSFKVRQ